MRIINNYCLKNIAIIDNTKGGSLFEPKIKKLNAIFYFGV